MSDRVIQTQVLIVGGGPIGLALAGCLGKRGIEATLIEQNDNRIGSAKMIVVSVRTMELCRQLGVADHVRNWGFPLDYPLDSAFCTSLDGFEIGRVDSPPLVEVADTPFSPERERPCPQTWFDPILRKFAEGLLTVDLRYRTKLVSFEQNENGVIAQLEDQDGPLTIKADYLVGSDGFSSTVREQLAIGLRGNRHLDTSTSIYVRSASLADGARVGRAYRYVFVDDNGSWAVLTTMDGRDLWRIQLIGHGSRDMTEHDVAQVLERMAGHPVEFQFEGISSWIRKMTVADRFADGRVFLAGDSAHAHPPNGGLGMNTGIQDAFDLGWKLAATLKGWGGPRLLESYDIERRPASARAAEESLANYHRLTRYPAVTNLDEDSDSGAAARATLGAALVEENRKAWTAIGVHLGTCYQPSPIIIPDDAPIPPDERFSYTPSSVPGCRAPHFALPDGRSVLDLFGDEFVLLNFSDLPGHIAEEAAKALGVPLRVEPILDPTAAELYERRFVLVRPDGHVAWRSDELPSDFRRIIRTVSGHGPAAAACRQGDPSR